MNSYLLFLEVLKIYNIKEVALLLNLHLGTVKRWEKMKAVPDSYFGDLNSLLGNKYKEKISFRSKDQFFTKPSVAKYCYKKAVEVAQLYCKNVKQYIFIEPSSGGCDFFKLFPKDKRIGIDICPVNNVYKNEIIVCDYLKYYPENVNRYFVIGNPPFGLRGNLALRFINHSAEFADFVAFILPPLFDSNGKGSPMKRVEGYKLVHSEKLPLDSYIYPDGTPVKISTIFQVWTKYGEIDFARKQMDDISDFVEIFSVSNGGTSSSKRNVDRIDFCDLFLPSTCFSGMKVYDRFEKLPNKRGYGIIIKKNKEKILQIIKAVNWEKIAFLSTNSALNLRKDLIIRELVKQGIKEET